MMRLNRREFLRAAGIGVAAAAATPILRAYGASPIVGNRLRLPTEWTGGDLEALVTSAEVWPGTTTELWTFGGTWPGPLIRMRAGEQFRAHFVNRLAEPTTVHWHGLVVPPAMDGHPMQTVEPGASFDYAFPVLNRAGTYWYHPHPHERTAAQVYKGMAGVIIVEDEREQALDLPRGAYDLPLVVQDRYLAGARSFDYATTSAQRLNGLLGDTAFVNGTPDAYHEVDAGRYRLRVLNGSNARILKLGFRDGRPFSIIGTDGGLLDRPYEVADTLLAPAERVELIVDFSDLDVAEEAVLMSLAYGNATTPGQHGYELTLLRFVGSRRIGHTRSTPSTLVGLPEVAPVGEVSQTFILDTSPIPLGGHHHKINGEVFEMHTSVATEVVDAPRLWEIRNNHTMPHPMHVHGTQFRIVSRDGAAITDPRDMGWKDTVQLDGKESAQLIVRYEYTGLYLLHCHNLEHEDDGMMVNFTVVPPADVESERDLPTELDLQ
jgi:blue copper oxidase